jgi:hypothetical protein
MSTKPTTQSVPKKALQFDSPLQFASEGGDDPSLVPISMLGRSAKPIYHWYWGNVIHDMSGFSTEHPKVAIDYRHDDDEPIGYLDQFTADNNGLNVSGKLVSLNPTDPDDRVSQLKKLSAAGVPFQASIFFETSKIENVQPGASAEVNGYSIDGPAIIIRQWSLRGMAVCLYGADGRTHSKFSDDSSEVSIPCFLTEPTMTKKTLSNKAAAAAAAKKLAKTPSKSGKLPPAGASKFAGKNKQADDKEDDEELADEDDEMEDDEEVDADDAEDTDSEDSESEDENEQSDDDTEGKAKKHSAKSGKSSKSASRNELKKYIEAFGHKNGAEWFAEGLDYTSAMGKHCKELSAALSAKDAEIAELNKKLKAVNRGEKEPLKFSEDKDAGKDGKGTSTKTPDEFAHLGNGVGKFAASLKLPTPSRN